MRSASDPLRTRPNLTVAQAGNSGNSNVPFLGTSGIRKVQQLPKVKSKGCKMQEQDANPPKSRFASFPLLLFLTPPGPPWPWRQHESSCLRCLLYPSAAQGTCRIVPALFVRCCCRCASFLPCGYFSRLSTL
ncbi:hypothetical protein BDP55DRAFT_401564 [Colletotrichum godetiae]|uniref:Uncharacterized protein n=1 Tax=Colletotrichum godetiae TaxID=1209918 RepID=A0AAJ0EM49_9PEZI|nr:uncharacterized protein BDP55DRAFT_401564 [Colletotrichum godetiae]KAK1658290.1 hypothetical protein BDP55DRAFT_401564 [Colletotrichum godetiae]